MRSLWFNSKVNAVLSSMSLLPHGVQIGKWHARSVEHLYQASKCRSRKTFKWILDSPTPFDAKKRGRRLADEQDGKLMRSDWTEHRDVFMLRILKAAAQQNPAVCSFLLSTGDAELIHYAPWDEYWGTGRYGKGQNRMGKAWMEVRAHAELHPDDYAPCDEAVIDAREQAKSEA